MRKASQLFIDHVFESNNGSNFVPIGVAIKLQIFCYIKFPTPAELYSQILHILFIRHLIDTFYAHQLVFDLQHIRMGE